MQTLQTDSLLQGGRYKILSSLGQGGFGITYLALQSGLERKVAIKEFFMKELCERDESTSHVTLGTESSRETVNRFREKFLKEARNIAKLNHPNIVRIYDIFEENGTAYYVMEYAENGSLAEKLRKDGYLSEPVATRYILQVAEALNYLHQQRMNHLDVKPANIMLNEKDETVLIDFGLSKQYDAVTGNQTSTTPIGMSDGYAPIEQYKPGGVSEFSPQTDIYSLGATFFKLLTGSTPPSASDVIEDGVPVDELKAKSISQKNIDVICRAMEGRKKDRMTNVQVFIDGLKDTFSSTFSVPEQSAIDDETKVIAVKKEKTIQSRTFTVNGVSFDMILVQGGTFTMGATSEMKDSEDDEKPTHEVNLTHDYYIGETQVTQALWEAVMGNNPSFFEGNNRPVENVSWKDCRKFISKLNSMTGQNFRLPTEAEWEFAARGGNNSKHYKYSGSNNLREVAWYGNNSNETHNVGKKQPNELGIYDMSGNVWEWCSDFYGDYISSSQTNPTGPSRGANRVIRGGSWCVLFNDCRSSCRLAIDSSHRDIDLGFRLSLSELSAPEKPIEDDETKVIALRKEDTIQSRTFNVNGVSFDMILVQGGTFTMGATSEMKDSEDDEKPTHEVNLTHDYYIGETQVTQALWEAVMGNNPSFFEGKNRPVENVSWKDCRKFISKLNSMTGHNFRLPTEAEWEFAARGGNNCKHYKYSGSNKLREVAWYKNNSNNKTHDVSTKQPNELGIYDMSGNVWEWCSDFYGDYTSSSQTNPTGPNSGDTHVFRGGSWSTDAGCCRSSIRYNNYPDNRFYDVGLRIALSKQK